MGDADLNQQISRLVPCVDIGLVFPKRPLHLYVHQADLPCGVVDETTAMAVTGIVPGEGRIWHVEKITSPGG